MRGRSGKLWSTKRPAIPRLVAAVCLGLAVAASTGCAVWTNAAKANSENGEPEAKKRAGTTQFGLDSRAREIESSLGVN